MEDFPFHGQFEGVRKLESVGAEELDAVVLPGIVGRGENDACVKSIAAREEGNGRSSYDAGAFNAHVGLAQSGGERGGDPWAGFAGVAAQQNFWFGVCFAQRVAESETDSKNGGRVERVIASNGANAISAEEIARTR